MKLKSLLKRVFLFPINMLEKKVKQTNWYKNDIPNIDNYPGDAWYRKHLSRNYDLVNLGSSSAVFAFNYEGLEIKAFNWALKPQSMEYSFKVLKQYFSILKKGGFVIIPFCPFSGLSVAGKWADNANDKYFHILDSALVDDYSSVAQRRIHPFRSNPKEALKRLVKDVPSCSMYSYNLQCKTEDEFTVSAQNWIDFWKNQFGIDDLDAPLSEGNVKGRKCRIKTMKDIISFCLERDLCPIIVIPPVNKALAQHLTLDFMKNYIETFVSEVCDANVSVLNYLKDDRFSNNNFYKDAFIMNNVGGKKFTEQLLTDLGII